MKDTVYGREHLLRLNAIKRLQQAHLPLDEIHAHLAHATEAELLRLSHSDLPGQRPIGERPDRGTGENGSHPYRATWREESAGASVSSSSAQPILPTHASSARVYVLAPGVEVWVRDGSPAASQALVSDILNRYSTIHDDKDTNE